MKQKLIWMSICMVIVLGITGCGFFQAMTEDPFVGKWIGIVKVPGMGKSLLRVVVDPEEEGRYRVYAIAENYQQNQTEGTEFSAEKEFIWQTGAEMHFTGQLENNILHLNRMMQMSLMLSKVTGSLQLPDGTEIRKDTGKEYTVLKEELRRMKEAEYPGAKFSEKTN